MSMEETLNKVEETKGTADERKKGMIEDLRESAPHDVENVDLDRRYHGAIDYLDHNFAYFLTHVLNMGKPLFTSQSGTADVSLPKNWKDADAEFRFRFNPDLAKALTTEETAFVMAHETMHILLKHLSLMQGKHFDEYVLDDDGKPFTAARDVKDGAGNVIYKKGDPIKTNRKFNIAADCVINDYLNSMGLSPGRLTEHGMFGPKTVGYDCSNATVAEVWRDVPDPDPDQRSGAGGGGGIPVEGAGAENLPGGGSSEGFDDHDWMENPDAGQEQANEDAVKDAEGSGNLPQDVKDKNDEEDGKKKGGKDPGSGVGGESNWAREKGVSLKWVEILKKVSPDIFRKHGKPPRPDWSRQRRKLSGVVMDYPEMKLPAIREASEGKGDQPMIVMALDTSGSCAHYANRFITLAKSIPQDKVKVMALTFTTVAQELDLEDPKYRSGGTSFGCIEQYIQEKVVPELKHYPKAVVVITDGAAQWGGSQPDEKDGKKWLWMLTDTSYKTYCIRQGQDYLIDDFVKEGRFDDGL